LKARRVGKTRKYCGNRRADVLGEREKKFQILLASAAPLAQGGVVLPHSPTRQQGSPSLI